MTKLSKNSKKELRATADEFLAVIKERVNMLVLLEDIDGLGRLVDQVEIIGAYEVIKALKDKGLSAEITALCDKAGKMSLPISS